MLQSLVDQILGRAYWFLVWQGHGSGGDDFRVRELRVLQGAAKSVLHQKLLEVEVGLRLHEALLVGRYGVLSANDFDGSKASDLDLLLIVRQRFLRKGKGLLLHPHVFVRKDQVPVQILNLVDCRGYLQAKGNVCDLAVVLRNADQAIVRQKAETLQ